MSTIGPALSGMLAATARLDASAQRVAGVRPVGSAPPTQKAQGASAQNTASSQSATAAPMRPLSSGYFFNPEPEQPDPAMERVEQMQALNQFKANLQSLLAGDRMTREALKI
jgi:hypothetical protein